MNRNMMGARKTKLNEANAADNVGGWSEGELITAAKNGHGAAFGMLCERHEEMILRVTFRITRNREDAEDAGHLPAQPLVATRDPPVEIHQPQAGETHSRCLPIAQAP